jgi:uncharacterized protein YndB with AHSA1/START domain
MAVVNLERRIQAPLESVFRAIGDPNVFGKVVGGVTQTVFLSEATSGAGTRFRQTRTVGGRENTMDFEITEWVAKERIRIVNEIHGTVWDSVFSFAPADGATRLTLRMETRSRPLLARVLMPIMLALFIKKAIAWDLDAVKAYCEGIGE